MDNQNYGKFTIIIPSYNEAKTISHVIDEGLKVTRVAELIIVDDGSGDDTKEVIGRFKGEPRLVYLKHKSNKGKGAALKTGLKRAKTDVVMFLDADLYNITAFKINKIAKPVLTGEVDLSRATFRRLRGRITEYAVKPMMRILFPDMEFDQPITGQICAKKEFLESLNLEKKYGVDIGILFDAIHAGQRIVEVDIGWLEHRANDEKNIAEMARQVLETMIQKAGLIQHKYKLVIFTLDETLIKRQELKKIFDKLGIGKEVDELQRRYADEEISFSKMGAEVGKLLKGRKVEEVEKIVNKPPLTEYALEVINALKKRRYGVAIISSNFSPVVLPIAKRLGVEVVDCVYLDNKKGCYNGNISAASQQRWINEKGELTFSKAFDRVLKISKVKPLETIMVANSVKSLPLHRAAGLSIAYKPKDKELKEAADKTISMLAEILAIVE